MTRLADQRRHKVSRAWSAAVLTPTHAYSAWRITHTSQPIGCGIPLSNSPVPLAMHNGRGRGATRLAHTNGMSLVPHNEKKQPS